jgi:N-hydroxyarylamine O-acetyltransferase
MALLNESLLRGYLNRIQHHSGNPHLPPPTLQTLASLQWAHLNAVPFENLSLRLPAAGKCPTTTSLPSVYNKLVTNKRGGYCFEVRQQEQ